MFAVLVRFRVKSGEMAAFMPEMLANARASLKSEPGCQQFDVLTDPDHVDEVALYEIYDDAAAFDTHRQMPHYLAFSKVVERLVASVDVTTWSQVDR